MATSQVNGSQTTPSSTRNNGGAVINGGESASCSSLASANSIKYVGTIDNNHADKILINGQFNTLNIAPISATPQVTDTPAASLTPSLSLSSTPQFTQSPTPTITVTPTPNI